MINELWVKIEKIICIDFKSHSLKEADKLISELNEHILGYGSFQCDSEDCIFKNNYIKTNNKRKH